MAIKIGINGFGRIGRMVLRTVIENYGNAIQVIGINDVLDPDYLVYLLKNDTVRGPFNHDVKLDGGFLVVDGQKIKLFTENDPLNIGWGPLGVDVVVEATGFFLTAELADAHLRAGAKKVIMTAPSKDATPQYVYGVNDSTYNGQNIISVASSTTNCIAPIAKVLNDNIGIVRGLVAVIDSSTSSYKTEANLMDRTGKKWRSHSIPENLVPSSTGAAKAVGKVVPELNGKITGSAILVPVSSVSYASLTLELRNPPAKDNTSAYQALVDFMKRASEGAFKGIIGYTEDHPISSDYHNTPYSVVFSARDGIALDTTFMKVALWYDNESGFCRRICDMIQVMCRSKGIEAANTRTVVN